MAAITVETTAAADEHGRAEGLRRTAAHAFSKAARAVRSGVGTVAVQAPPAATRAAREGARDTVVALQGLPDHTLRSAAAGSVAFGAGLYVAGRRRMALAVVAVTALVAGAAAATRPHDTEGRG